MKILLADDHELVRDTLVAFLEREADFIVTPTHDLMTACDILHDDAHDLNLLDYEMPGMNGLEGLDKAIEADGGNSVAIISGTTSKTIAQHALDAGAIGFLPKSMSAKSLINAVRFMQAGEVFVPMQFMASKAVISAIQDFSELELNVLRALQKGLGGKQIAEEFNMQDITIQFHIRTLYEKLNAKNRNQAIENALDTGIL